MSRMGEIRSHGLDHKAEDPGRQQVKRLRGQETVLATDRKERDLMKKFDDTRYSRECSAITPRRSYRWLHLARGCHNRLVLV